MLDQLLTGEKEDLLDKFWLARNIINLALYCQHCPQSRCKFLHILPFTSLKFKPYVLTTNQSLFCEDKQATCLAELIFSSDSLNNQLNLSESDCLSLPFSICSSKSRISSSNSELLTDSTSFSSLSSSCKQPENQNPVPKKDQTQTINTDIRKKPNLQWLLKQYQLVHNSFNTFTIDSLS